MPTKNSNLESQPLTRTQRRRQQTRSALVNAVRKLTAEKGVDAVTISEIAEEADIGKGSFYNYFESKDELLKEAIESIIFQSGETLPTNKHEAQASGFDIHLLALRAGISPTALCVKENRMDLNKRFDGHIPVRVNDIDETREFYKRTLGLRHSGTARLSEDAINVMTRDAICFLSCGDLRHDFGAFQAHDEKYRVIPVTRDDLHHISFTLRPETSLSEFKEHLRKEEVPVTDGPALPDPTETYTSENCIHFRDPNGHFVEVHEFEVDADAR